MGSWSGKPVWFCLAVPVWLAVGHGSHLVQLTYAFCPGDCQGYKPALATTPFPEHKTSPVCDFRFPLGHEDDQHIFRKLGQHNPRARVVSVTARSAGLGFQILPRPLNLCFCRSGNLGCAELALTYIAQSEGRSFYVRGTRELDQHLMQHMYNQNCLYMCIFFHACTYDSGFFFSVLNFPVRFFSCAVFFPGYQHFPLFIFFFLGNQPRDCFLGRTKSKHVSSPVSNALSRSDALSGRRGQVSLSVCRRGWGTHLLGSTGTASPERNVELHLSCK